MPGSIPIRPLFIDFNVYTDGDEEFKKELIDSMIDNLEELQQALHLASQNNDAPLFSKVCHKIKATLHMLEDKELLDSVEKLKVSITDSVQVALLGKACIEIIESLRKG
jgi:hypothetical protein